MSISAKDLEQIAARLDSHEDRLDDLETQEFLQPGVPGLGFTHIETLSGVSGDYDFTSIPSTHKTLALIYSLRTNRNALNDTLQIEINGAGSGYDSVRIQWFHSNTINTGETLAGVSMFPTFIAGDNGPSNEFAGGIVLIPNYADTDKNKELFAVGSVITGTTTGTIRFTAGSGVYKSTSAITRVRLDQGSGGTQFQAGSKASLYGID